MSSTMSENSLVWPEDDGEAEDPFFERGAEVESLLDLEPEEELTSDPLEATEEGYSYLAPSDAPVLPSDDLEGADIAAGFAPSMEETHPDREVTPARVEEGNLEILEHVHTALRENSETGHLTGVEVCVSGGVVLLSGTVDTEDDIAIVDDIVSDLEGVRGVRNRLRAVI